MKGPFDAPWNASFEVETPRFFEVPYFDKDPYLALEALPVATVSLRIPEQLPQPITLANEQRESRIWNEHWTATHWREQLATDWRNWTRYFRREDEILLREAHTLVNNAEGGFLTEQGVIAAIYLIERLQSVPHSEALRNALKSLVDNTRARITGVPNPPSE
jgi:hypothetical protein